MPASIRAVSTAQPATSTFNVTKPSGTVAGDLLLAFHSADQGALTSLGTPTGGVTWQLLGSRSSGSGYDNKTKIWWKIAGGSEPANYGFSQAGSATGVVAIVAIVDADTALTPVTANVGNDTFSTSAPTPGITPAGSDDLELRWVSGNPDGEPIAWTPPSGYAKHADLQGTNQTGCLASKSLTSATATGSLNFVASDGLGYRHGFTVAVASTPVVAGRRVVLSTAAVHRAASW